MQPIITKLFTSHGGQAVLIPAALRLETDTVTIEKHGDTLIVRPTDTRSWDEFFADESLVLPEDFDCGEDPPPAEGSPL